MIDNVEELARLKKEVADQIKARATELNLSNAELARRTGQKPSNVGRLISGEANMNMRTLVRAAEALGLTVRVIMEPKEAA